MTAVAVETTTTAIERPIADLQARVTQTALLESLRFAATSLPVRSQSPVLAGVLIEGAGSTVSVSAFDFEVSIRDEIDGFGSGRALIAGRLLLDIVKGLPKGEQVTFTTEAGKVTVECDGYTYQLATLPLDEYPQLPAPGKQLLAELTSVQLGKVGDVLTAAGRDTTLPVLTGVKFMPNLAGRLCAAATDRYRLATYDTGIEVHADSPAPLVPRLSIAAAVKYFDKEDVIRLSVTTDKDPGDMIVTFSARRRTLTTRVLEGEFPRWQSLLPDTSASQLNVPTKDLVKATQNVAIVAARTSPVRLTLSERGALLEAGGLDDAQASKLIPGEFTGDSAEMTIAFNPAYLIDGVKAVGAPDQVTFAFTGPTKPAVMFNTDQPDYRYLLMPVRLAG